MRKLLISRRRRLTTPLASLLALALVAGACTDDDGAGSADDATSATTAPGGFPESGPPGDPAQTVTRADVDAAVEAWQPLVEEAMAETGVPGASAAVVFEDEVVFTGGWGVTEVGGDEPVGPDTVFQLASLSKPVGSTVMAGLVGDGVIDWDQPVSEVDPGFALAEPAVTERATFADLYAHRSGLPGHAGDLLEDLGWDRTAVLERLAAYPLFPFRAHYDYTNFGLTQAAVAAASVTGTEWEDLSAERLYEPLGMASTSSRFDDYLAAEDRAIPHVRDDEGAWVAEFQRDPDAQSPAGGVSSTAEDMARWVRLQINGGTVDGEELVDADALLATHTPQITSTPPRSPTARPGFYGLGWGVGYDEAGRTRLNHSGAFALGAATTVGIVLNEQLGVVVLTNGQPHGFDQAVVEMFLDLATEGEVTRDWLGLYTELIEATIYPEPEVDYGVPVEDPTPAQDDAAYVGTYESPIYGTAEVRAASEGLELVLGPEPLVFPLDHYDGDVFWFEPTGENAVNPSDATFGVGSDGVTPTLHIGWLDGEDPELQLGTFSLPLR